MHNWSVDTTILQQDKVQYTVWRLEQMVNFGLEGNEKINKASLLKHWSQLQLDPHKKNYLAFLLWGTQPS